MKGRQLDGPLSLWYSSLMDKIRYRILVPLASLLSDAILRWLERNWRLWEDPADGWNFWLDASYAQWCRIDKRNARRGV